MTGMAAGRFHLAVVADGRELPRPPHFAHRLDRDAGRYGECGLAAATLSSPARRTGSVSGPS